MKGLIQPICYPQPFPDEAPVGYLIRVCEANQFKKIRWLYPEDGPVFSIKPTDILVRLLESPWTGYEAIADNIRSYLSIHQNDINASVLRYCPICLQEEGYFPVQRQLKLTTVCVKHKCWLIDQCYECKEPLKLAGFHSVKECSCGADFTDASIFNVPESVIRFQEFIDGVKQYSGSEDFWLKSYLEPNRYGLLKRLELLFGFAQWQPIDETEFSKSGVFSGFTDISTAKPYVLAAANTFFSNDDRFTPFLYSLHHEVYENQDEGDRLFKRFYKHFFHHVDDSIEPLYKALEHYVNEYWQYFLSQKNSLFTESMIEGHYWVPLQTASKRFEVGKTDLRRAIAAKEIKSKKKYYIDTDRTYTLVYQPDVMNFIHRSQNQVNGVTAANILGVTKKQFYQLLDNKLIEGEAPSKDRGSVWKFERVHLESILEKYKRDLLILDDQYVPLPDAIRKIGNRIQLPFIRLLQAIEQDEIETKVNPKLVGLRSLCLSEEGLHDWYEAQTSKDRLYTVCELATELRVLPDLISGLIQFGALSSFHFPEMVGNRITKRSVDQFKERYVSLAKLAKRCGLTPQSLRARLVANKILAVDEQGEGIIELPNRIYYRHQLLSSKEFGPLVAAMDDWM